MERRTLATSVFMFGVFGVISPLLVVCLDLGTQLFLLSKNAITI